MTYDAARRQIVLFGGVSEREGGTVYDDTWVWDGVQWQQRTPQTKPARRHHAGIAYDAKRGKVLMYGGHGGPRRTDSMTHNDLWEWDGSTWREIVTATRPGTCQDWEDGLLAYDAARGVTVLMQCDAPSTWEFDGTAWLRKQVTVGPDPRSDFAMAYDVLAQRVMVFGGWSDAYKSDLWAWDGTSWKLEAERGISARSETSMAYDERARALTVVGGGPVPHVIEESYEQDMQVIMQYGKTRPGAAQERCSASNDYDDDGFMGCADPDGAALCFPGCYLQTCSSGLGTCGDGVCSPTESYLLCPADCAGS